MAFIGLQKGSGKRSGVREKSVESQGILIWKMSGNPVKTMCAVTLYAFWLLCMVILRKDSLFSHFHNFFQSV